MHLNPDQKLALDHGQPVPLVVDDTQCVLIKRDVYEKNLASLDWTVEEMDMLAAEAADRLDDTEAIQ
jgi:hypothetical protein